MFVGEVLFMDSYYARQPIFNLINDTIAYELLYRNSIKSMSYNATDGDHASASVINSSFFGDDPRIIFRGKKTYINFTENLILNRTAFMLPSDILVIEVLEDVKPTDEVIVALKELHDYGYKLALDDYVVNDENFPMLQYADIIKIDFRCSKSDIERTAAICQKLSKRMLAEKIETDEDLNYAKSLGAVFFQGYYFSKPIIVSLKNPTPLQTTFLHLVAKLSDDNIEISDISKIIQTDAAMTLKFLRFVNFLRYDWMEKIKSVHQAVMIAGLKKTRDFIYFVGLQQIKQGFVDEIITTGFFRAKFCESLSNILLKNYSNTKNIKNRRFNDEMYLMGLISIIIDCNFDTSTESIDSLPLSSEIKSGLFGQDTVFGDVMRTVLAYESGQWDNVDIFCEKYKISQNDLSTINLACIKHTNALVRGIGR